MVNTDQNFLSFKTFERFENYIMYDCHSFLAKIERSEDFSLIAKQDKSIIPMIYEYLCSESKLDTAAAFYTFDLGNAWIVLLSDIVKNNNIQNSPTRDCSFDVWLEWTKTRFLKFKTAKGLVPEIIVDTAEEVCLPFGFRHNDLVLSPKKDLVLIAGVAPGNDGVDVLWYVLQHPTIKNEVCYWVGERNLLVAGFELN